MARWAEDGSVAKRGGKGISFVRCLTIKQIEADLATIMAAPYPEGNKRTRSRDVKQPIKRMKQESNPDELPSASTGNGTPEERSDDT